MSSKKWLLFFCIVFYLNLAVIVGVVVYIDPYIHYHKPLNEYYYTLDMNEERYVNNGIIKNFEYDALITGTSMTENFKTSEFDNLFNVNSIKVPFYGATYKELNDNIKIALKNNNNIKIVISSLDQYNFYESAFAMRNDLGTFPSYLYNDRIYDDIYYVLNRDVIYETCFNMLVNSDKKGVTSFDDYANWNDEYSFGKEYVLDGIESFEQTNTTKKLSEKEKEGIQENININVIQLAEEYPNVQFYYFLPPYSVAWWGEKKSEGMLEYQLEAERVVIEMTNKVPNIKLYSWNDCFYLTGNLDNYKDTTHYGEWVNSLLLEYMKNNKGLITIDNYENYLDRVRYYYSKYDFNSLFN